MHELACTSRERLMSRGIDKWLKGLRLSLWLRSLRVLLRYFPLWSRARSNTLHAAQDVGASTLPAIATRVATREGPTSGDSAPGELQLRSRSRRVNAGSKLRGILAEEKRTLSDVDSEESRVDAVDSESGESHSLISQFCCVCSAAVSSEDVLVHCCASQCSAVSHCKCGGYTTKGAKRAKFYCPVQEG